MTGSSASAYAPMRVKWVHRCRRADACRPSWSISVMSAPPVPDVQRVPRRPALATPARGARVRRARRRAAARHRRRCRAPAARRSASGSTAVEVAGQHGEVRQLAGHEAALAVLLERRVRRPQRPRVQRLQRRQRLVAGRTPRRRRVRRWTRSAIPSSGAPVHHGAVRAARQRDAAVQEAALAVAPRRALGPERGRHPVAELVDEAALRHRDHAQPGDPVDVGATTTPQCSMRWRGSGRGRSRSACS